MLSVDITSHNTNPVDKERSPETYVPYSLARLFISLPNCVRFVVFGYFLRIPLAYFLNICSIQRIFSTSLDSLQGLKNLVTKISECYYNRLKRDIYILPTVVLKRSVSNL